MANVGPTVWYLQDNSTPVNTSGTTPGTVGWSAVTAWPVSTLIAPGTIRRQSGAQATGASCTIATTVLTVAGAVTGTWTIGQLVQGTGVTANTIINSRGTGTGGTGTYNLSQSSTVSVGEAMTGSFVVGNERTFVATQAASQTTSATEPAWVLTKGGKTTDGSITWQECTGQPGVNGDLTNTPTWAQQHTSSTTIAVGLIIQDGAGDAIFIASAGTTIGGSEPTWVKTVGQPTTDNAVTWVCISLVSAGVITNFAAWAAPFARAQNAATTNWMTAGNALDIADNHAETQAFAVTVTFPGTTASPNSINCISHSGSLPAIATTTGASLTTTGGSNFTVDGSFSATGIKLSATTGSIGGALFIGVNSGIIQLNNCTLIKAGTTGANAIIFGGTFFFNLNNTTMQFGSTGDNFSVGIGNFRWKNTASAIQGGTLPTTLYKTGDANHTSVVVFDGVDLSAITGNLIGALGITQTLTLMNCALGSGVTVAATPSDYGSRVYVVTSDSAATNYQQQIYDYAANLLPSTTVYRSGGASDGTTPISWSIVTNANATWLSPFEAFPIAEWNTVITPTVRTVTAYGLANAATVPNNDQTWIESEYFGSAASPLGHFVNDTKANNLATGSALTADSTSNWAAGVTARQNSHAYSVGNTISLASNPNRVFFCTASTGSSAGSEPAGYASAVDGGSVTDGNCTFRAGCRFSMVVTLTAQLVGDIRTTVKAAEVSSTFFVDPKQVFS